MRKLYLTLICLIALAASQASMAQNMTQLEAIKNLTGFWTTIPSDNVPQSTLNFENHSNPAQRYLTTTGFASKSYDYWSIHTNTYNFSTGVIQATNSDPSLNDNYNYRNLTPRTCEFRINGYWVNAQKGRAGQQTNTPTNNYHPINNVATPANNNRPATNVVRPANNNNNYRPTNNNNNGQYKDGSDLQLTTPPDVPATLGPSNNNARPTGNTPTPTNNNSQTQTENNNGRIAVDNNHTPPANSNNNVRIVIGNNYTPPTHNTSGQGSRVKNNATTPDSSTDNNSNNNQRRSDRKRNVQINKSSSNNSSSNPVKSRRRAGRR